MKKTKKLEHQPSPKVLACRRNGKLGGLARAKKTTSEQRQACSAKGGRATLDRYGSGMFTFMNKKKKFIGRYRKPVTQIRRSKAA